MKKYIVDYQFFEKDKRQYIIDIIISIVLNIGRIMLFNHLNFNPNLFEELWSLGICSFAGIIGIIGYIKITLRIKVIDDLCMHGTLIKNLPYRVKVKENYKGDTNIIETTVRIYIDYTTRDGKVLHLKGDNRYSIKTRDEDGFADLLIDENNPKHYFIDFNISQLDGQKAKDVIKPINTDNTYDPFNSYDPYK